MILKSTLIIAAIGIGVVYLINKEVRSFRQKQHKHFLQKALNAQRMIHESCDMDMFNEAFIYSVTAFTARENKLYKDQIESLRYQIGIKHKLLIGDIEGASKIQRQYDGGVILSKFSKN